ncbi:MAG: class A beta-lactamase [Pelosinus sp.]|nr:class A beta-lactamase [Pelosinus sp.]
MRTFRCVKSKVKWYKVIVLMLVFFSFIAGGQATAQHPVDAISDEACNAQFLALENAYGAKLGVYALDTETNEEVAFQADDRFAYCSTFKILAVGAILRQDSLAELKQVVKYSKDDILSYAPITKNNVDKGMSLAELCNAALRFSDNTAANLLFRHIGGPAGLKAALVQLGDTITQPARIEPELNETLPGDIQDTTTPRQLVFDLKAYTTGNILSEEKQRILIDWMTGNTVGSTLIRAGVPAEWVVADKSGSGPYGRRNDIAMVRPLGRKPIFIAILSTHDIKEAKYDDKLIAQASKIVADFFAVPENGK